MKEWDASTLTSSFLLVLFDAPLATPLHFSPPIRLFPAIVIAQVFRIIRPVGDDVVVAAAALLPFKEKDNDVISSTIRADFFSFIIALVLWTAKEADNEDEDEDVDEDDDIALRVGFAARVCVGDGTYILFHYFLRTP